MGLQLGSFQKSELVGLFIIILILIPVELRLFNVSGEFVLVNFKPALLAPFIFFLFARKTHFKEFCVKNKFICLSYLTLPFYYLIQGLILNRVEILPVVFAKHYIYLFFWYYVWYVFNIKNDKRFIYQFYWVSSTGMVLYVLFCFYSGEYFGYKDPYWFTLTTVSVSLVLNNKYKFKNFFGWIILSLSLSRTAILAFIVSIFIRLNKRSLLYLSFGFAIIIIVVSRFEIPQLQYYLDTIVFLFDADNINNLLKSDFNSIGGTFTNGSDNYRVIEYLRSIEIIRENPFLGVGFENYAAYASKYFFTDSLVRLPHNEFIRHLVEGGPFIFIFYIVLYLSSLRIAIVNSTLPIYFASLVMFIFTASNFLTLFLLILSRFYRKVN